MTDKTVLITGSTDGIGKLTAHELASRGARVLVHGRDRPKTEHVAKDLRTSTGNGRAECYLADFSSLDNVRMLAREVSKQHDELDVLINNAGIGFGSERQTSEEGYELRFTVNYLAPFLLTHLLLPSLRKASPSRVVNVSSAGQYPIDFNDLMLENHYSPQRAYGQSKLALIMFTFDLGDRLRDDHVTVNSLHPGTFLDTKMVRNAGITPRGKAEDGAHAVVKLASAPDLQDVTGKYFDRRRESKAIAQAYDTHARKKLWEISEKLTGLA